MRLFGPIIYPPNSLLSEQARSIAFPTQIFANMALEGLFEIVGTTGSIVVAVLKAGISMVMVAISGVVGILVAVIEERVVVGFISDEVKISKVEVVLNIFVVE